MVGVAALLLTAATSLSEQGTPCGIAPTCAAIMTEFRFTYADDGNRLTWTVSTENDRVEAYALHSVLDQKGPFVFLHRVEAHGSCGVATRYSWLDINPHKDTIGYTLTVYGRDNHVVCIESARRVEPNDEPPAEQHEHE